MMSIPAPDEEGQIVDEVEVVPVVVPHPVAVATVTPVSEISEAKILAPISNTNLGLVTSIINDTLNRFHSTLLPHSPSDDKSATAQLLRRYPKHLTRFSLLHLQFQDYLFRETFLLQVLIFVEAILTPVNVVQKKLFPGGAASTPASSSPDKERKMLEGLKKKVLFFLQDHNHQKQE
jgi:hypothetical protein